MLAGRFVLENRSGEVVRTFAVESDTLFVVYRHDVRRLDVVADLEELKCQEIPFELIRKTSPSSVMRRPVSLNNGAQFRFTHEIEKTARLVQVPEESQEQEKKIYKYTAYTQMSIMLFILIVGLLIEPFFMGQPEEVVVIVPPPQIQKAPKSPPVTVKASETKVNPRKKVAHKRVESKVRHAPKRLVTKTRSPRKENAPVRTKVRVENVGALGVLGGARNGSKRSAGFNYNAQNDSSATSWSGSGSGGAGGLERAVHGKGLVASAAGNGGQVEAGGGYGTRGKAGGGRPGYGSMNMGGTAAAYFEPVQEEALVTGGLDKDQIAAVINRHIGEVIYCYEKGLQVKPGLSGRVAVKFVINGSGIVSTAGLASSSLHSAQVEGCILNRLRTWRFPKPVGGVNVKVTYPFVLKRVSHG